MKTISVIDTETTWQDEVMSIGIVVADTKAFDIIDKKYYVLTPYKFHGGYYSHALYINGIKPHLECSREAAIEDLVDFLRGHGVSSIFAYNASFDKRHLPEIQHYNWHEITKIAAYVQHNPKIPKHLPCCSTGRLKGNFGVEPMYRLLSKNNSFFEKHNALTDAIDELEIVKMIGRSAMDYPTI